MWDGRPAASFLPTGGSLTSRSSAHSALSMPDASVQPCPGSGAPPPLTARPAGAPLSACRDTDPKVEGGVWPPGSPRGSTSIPSPKAPRSDHTSVSPVQASCVEPAWSCEVSAPAMVCAPWPSQACSISTHPWLRSLLWDGRSGCGPTAERSWVVRASQPEPRARVILPSPPAFSFRR